MSKFVEIALQIQKIILVEVTDDSSESISLAVDVAEQSIDDEIWDSEIVDIHNTLKDKRGKVDDVISLLDQYLEEEE